MKTQQEKEWNAFEIQQREEADEKLRAQLEMEYLKKLDNSKVVKH